MDKILKKLKKKDINCEEALEMLSKKGYCPNLLNDDAGRWAVTFDGMQTVPDPDKPIDIVTSVIIEANKWKDTIYDALIWGMEN